VYPGIGIGNRLQEDAILVQLYWVPTFTDANPDSQHNCGSVCAPLVIYSTFRGVCMSFTKQWSTRILNMKFLL